ncbi:MAG: hypothetical protein A2Y34_07080 [Spirochaetes bacterium GWC1_27_15]|nr:MAG: hypothetical protein A2Y34_07080 [Spirochaetes bacterium GWC1_27_15]
MQSAINALLNTILVSIPEEIFLVVMTLIFLKRFDMLDVRMWKYNLKWITIPAFPVAIMINVFRYIIIIPKPIATITDGIIFYTLMMIIIKSNSFNFIRKDYLKILLYFTLSLIILGVLENSTYPVIMFLINKPFEYFNNNIIWNFLLVLPSRIFEYIILFYSISKQNNVVRIKLFDSIISNKLYFKVMIFLTIMFNVLSIFLVKFIVYDKILEKLSLLEKVLVSEITLIFPVVVVFIFILLINDLLVKQKLMQQTYENLAMQDDILFDVEDENERM